MARASDLPSISSTRVANTSQIPLRSEQRSVYRYNKYKQAIESGSNSLWNHPKTNSDQVVMVLSENSQPDFKIKKVINPKTIGLTQRLDKPKLNFKKGAKQNIQFGHFSLPAGLSERITRNQDIMRNSTNNSIDIPMESIEQQ